MKFTSEIDKLYDIKDKLEQKVEKLEDKQKEITDRADMRGRDMTEHEELKYDEYDTQISIIQDAIDNIDFAIDGLEELNEE